MLFNKKPILYFEFLERRIRYLAVDSSTHAILEKDELLFDTEIITEGNIVDESLIENRLRALLAEKKWRNAKASIILPDDHVILKEKKIPSQLVNDEIRDYITLHMNHSIRVPFKRTKFHYEILEQEETEQTVMIVVYSQDAIDQYEKVLEDISLKPLAADISFLTLYRILMSQTNVEVDEEKHILVLQWSPVDTQISVFHKGVPRFNRHSRSARITDYWDVAKDGEWLWKNDAEAMEAMIQDKLDVMERFLDFYRYSVLHGEDGVSEIYLAGDFPNLENVQKRLSSRFYLPIHQMEIADQLEVKYLPLYGLSLREQKYKGMKKKKIKKGASSNV